jgi:hypothetical protein
MLRDNARIPHFSSSTVKFVLKEDQDENLPLTLDLVNENDIYPIRRKFLGETFVEFAKMLNLKTK